jgi:hypothetical protein
MLLAVWLRERLWRANDWPGELGRLRTALASETRSSRTIERTLDLARATDECDPDRSKALALYLDAWRAGHPGALARAKQLAVELRAHMTIGELARGENDPVLAATAYLDAGLPDLSLEPLQQAVAARPRGTADGLEILLALVDHRRCDPAREIADSLDRAARATGAARAEAHVHAVRVARLANLPGRIPAIMMAATRACPDDSAIDALVETRLFEANQADRLVEHYRARFERAATDLEYVERVRAAGVELVSRDLQPGLGLRLLRMSLERAYAAAVPDLVSHVATWELIVANARVQQSTRELVPLIVQAMASPLSDDVAVYLARLGLEIVWQDAKDSLAAQPYAATLLDYVPDHPLAVAFAREVAPETLPVARPASATPTARIPAIKTPTSRIPAIKPPSQTPTMRMPALGDEQVKRAPAPALAKPASVSGRLALLRPPPPRTTTLSRDTSPIPLAPQPAASGPQRAPRVVVPVDAVVELPSGEFFTTLLRDVSASGAFVVTKRKLEIDAVVSLELRIPIAGSVDQLTFRTDARVARRTDVGCGLAFIDPPPTLVSAIHATIG